ncbi:MAG: xanthine dehydrogenase family protein molybdopterin-binding subunit [Candidatus Tectomicrobia bacterium]|nr:xanthine dehydrogenase family protein molybdopterin-binding subunit [Candidatus Tectomicrobia bacterium]
MKPAHRVVGQRIPRLDGAPKATGRAVYGTDVTLPGMLVGKILRSPYAHARIQKIDTRKAKALPGVKAVITAEDTPLIRYGFREDTDPGNARLADKLPLAHGKVRFAGEEVAAVAAVDDDTADRALALIEVEYEPLPLVMSPVEAMREGAPEVHEGVKGNVAHSLSMNFGDVDRALSRADVVVEDEFVTSQVEHCCLETQGCLAQYDPAGRLTVWTSIQMPFLLRKHLAGCLGLAESQVRVIRTTIGGGFGKRMEMHDLHPICALLAKETGRPVRIVYSREEDFVGSRTRHPMHIRLRTGADKDGRILGQEMWIVTDNGAYMSAAPGVTFSAANYNVTLYSKVKDCRVDGRIVYTNKNYGGAYRGYGNPQATFAREVHIDVLAERLGIDPVEFRLRNATERGDVSACGYRITSCGMRECIERTARAVRWAEKKRDRKFGRGVGIACAVHCGGGVRVYQNTDVGSAIAKMEDDGTVVVLTGTTEIGSGQNVVIAAVVAEELGIPPEAVRVVSEDTDAVPWDLGTHGSRCTFVAGNAVRLAALDLRGQILRAAGEMLEADAQDLVAEDGQIYIRGLPDRRVGIAEVARASHYRKDSRLFIGRGVYDPPHEAVDKKTNFGNISVAYSFCAQAAEVEVDPETGFVNVLRLVAAQDVGFPISLLGVEGQIEGGVMQGVGYALMEEMVFDAASGQLLNGTLADYKLPTALDIPPIQTIVVSSDEKEGPFGAKGFAELPITPTAAAIANAVYDAVGARIRELPLSPDKIFQALKQRSGGRNAGETGRA